MELYQIKTFAVVAEEGNMTRAAKRLHASQSTISLHIKSLEEEFDVRLFLRTPKGMQPTSEGEALLEKAREVIDAVDRLKAHAQSLRGEVTGVVRVGLQTSPVYLRTPQLIKCIKENFPGLSVHFVQIPTWTIRSDIAGRRLDGGYFYSNCPPEEVDGILLENTILNVVGPASWQDKMENASWEDLAELPWIWTPDECSFHIKLEEAFSSRGLKATKAMIADSEDTHNALVRAENGLTAMRNDEASEGVKNGSFYVWPGGHVEVGLYFGFHKKRKADPTVIALLDCIGKVWKKE
ncbi:LysR family transcriptional regulator [Maridesulfovibrio hydrothermalis]|uniref:Transcriptional regulator, LysR family n=1 Tax=Maridesulfovibrio hydrothermalis AM13 = DSM 14728 TaxID=1121451 RepID=L0R9B2_9BACT|nr:LysR family transcriptional regulator [Maridesulfovibrio hydrothermalis]CCO22780.1 Transcriptional regulator, LysR family [Maridesulfovibrio hydrothermalis AM13 = DSM 14728]